jgi:hypothetical protein
MTAANEITHAGARHLVLQDLDQHVIADLGDHIDGLT